MSITQYLTNTLHGEVKPYLTQCTLATAIDKHKKKVQKGKENQRGRGDGKPEWLPLPTEVPLRYCKHKNEAGEDIGPLSEEECLLDLLRGQPKGNEVPKNKNHYILASADAEQVQQGHKSQRAMMFRQQARLVGGVPVIYVSKSVMILEELSGVSLAAINRVEKEKLKEGLISKDRGTKRKRDDGDGDDQEDTKDADGQIRAGGPKLRGLSKAKGPNPLSVRRKKPKVTVQKSLLQPLQDSNGEQAKKKNRRIRGKKHKENDTAVTSPVAENISVEHEA